MTTLSVVNAEYRTEKAAQGEARLQRRRIGTALALYLETFCNLAQLQYPKSATTIPKTFRKVTADNFPQWVFSGAKVAELRHTQSGPDPAPHPILDVGYPGSPFRARMS
jgi:hypothetical protein